MTRAFLLRSVDYRDADRIVTLLTEEHGRLEAIARNARKSRKRFGGSLQAACLIEVQLAPSRNRREGSLATLAEARVERPFLGIVTDLRRIGLASAALELVREVIQPGQPEPQIFDACETYLASLDDARDDTSGLLAFHCRVLSSVGLFPSLDSCGACGRGAPPDRPALFRPSLGSVVCRACGGGPLLLSAESRACMAAATGDTFLPTRPWPAQVTRQAGAALSAFIEAQLGKPLASADVLTQMESR